ncbi:MAG: molecular chaperone HtpG [Oscillospiraceae bacterium]|nr:molecular chaperone HtpG [Oscillospiraceae bacterium]
MNAEKGNVSINTENIFPIIKKWLYSEKDIFIRELVSNASDALNKLKKIVTIGEANAPDDGRYTIRVIVDKENRKISFMDNGIGMTDEEIKSYINQIAFSGAKDFIEKYKDKMQEEDQIIGHFGLGFYSSFMVSDRVVIETLSFREGAEAVKWTSDDGMNYSIEACDRTERGTVVSLVLSEDCSDYLEGYKVREVLKKYCSFLPFPIYLEDVEQDKKDREYKEKKKEENRKKKADERKNKGEKGGKGGEGDKGGEGAKDAKGDKDGEYGEETDDDIVYDSVPSPVNNTAPLWLKAPKDCSDEDYKTFYRDVFLDFDEPLFWIHLNLDYPFNLKGILYFPKLKHEFEVMEGQVNLYYNQVFVASNVKEVVPEFLLLLKGCLDCPDLPLNVSRSFLQNDSYVRKISSHITKKVADKLTSLFGDLREDYNKYWDDINPFIKYGCIKEEKFYDRVKDVIIYKDIFDSYITLKDYLEKAESGGHKGKVFYVTDEKQQAQYIKMFKDNDMDAVILKTLLDSHFIQFLEGKDRDVSFARIDSDISDSLKDTTEDADGKERDEETKELQTALETLFRRATGNDKLKVRAESLKAENVPGFLLQGEYPRRMVDMSRLYGSGGADMSAMFPNEETLVLNLKNRLIKEVVNMDKDESKSGDVDMICQHIFDMAVMSNKPLEAEAMTRFLERSNSLLEKLLQ